MRRCKKNVISFGLAVFVCLVALAPTVSASELALKAKVDSLFPIASSGVVMYRDLVEPAMDSIAALGAEAAPILIDKFTTKSARERHTIKNILKRIGKPAVPHLVRALSFSDGLVVQRVCWTLGEIADSSSVEPLMAVTDHGRWQVRDEALGALGDIGDSRASEVMLRAYDDPVGQVRKSASVATGKIALLEAVPMLVNMLGDEFYGARMSAMEALLKLDTPTVVTALTDSLGSANAFVGNLGCQILGRLGTDQAVEALLSQVSSEDPLRRAHAATAMIEADPQDNCGYREAILANEKDRLVLLKIKSAIISAKDDSR